MGGKAMIIQADVSDENSAMNMVEEVIKEFGGIDILVNNAGITRDGLFIRMKEDDWNAVINTNLTGIFNCTKVAAKYMMKKRSGKIINMSSVSGIMGNAGQTNYAAAKAGVIGFTKSLAREMASRGIHCKCSSSRLHCYRYDSCYARKSSGTRFSFHTTW